MLISNPQKSLREWLQKIQLNKSLFKKDHLKTFNTYLKRF